MKHLLSEINAKVLSVKGTNGNVLMLFLILLISSCETFEEIWTLPKKPELAVEVIGLTEAGVEIRGEIITKNIGPIDSVGFVIIKEQNVESEERFFLSKSGDSQYLFFFDGYDYDSYYEVSFFLYNEIGETRSIPAAFITPSIPGSPTVVFDELSNLSVDYVDLTATVTEEGDFPVTSRGFCISKSPFPTIQQTTVAAGSGEGSFTAGFSGLEIETTYHIRAFASNQIATTYSQNIEVKTKGITDLGYGDFFRGGILFYVFQPGDNGYVEGEVHGLIAAPEDQGKHIWGCLSNEIETASEIGSGEANTQIILENCFEQDIAAKVCNNLNLNGYSDWFLPSLEELNLLYENLFLADKGNFTEVTLTNNQYYWSSSTGNFQLTVAVLGFRSPVPFSGNKYKDSEYLVRPVRRF